MALKSLQLPHLRRFYAPAILAILILFLLFLIKRSHPSLAGSVWQSRLPPKFPWSRRPTPPLPTLPELEILGLDNTSGNSTTPDPGSQYCTDRFGPAYLSNLRDHSIEYCGASPRDQDRSSRLTCFHIDIRGEGEEDSFCIAQGAVLDPEKKGFVLDCAPRSPTEEETKRGLIPFERIRGSWYDTGPRVVFDRYVNFLDRPRKKVQQSNIAAGENQQRSPPISILVKREGSGHPWHSLMEIWSLTHTMDVLRLSANPDALGAPFFHTPDDIRRARVVILDDHEDGPFFDLWRLTAGHNPVRLSAALEALQDNNKTSSSDTALIAGAGQPHNVVVPLPGATNPVWQNDWEERNCTDASLVKLFVRRVLHHLGVESFKPKAVTEANVMRKRLRLTFVIRRGSRKLLGRERLLEAVRHAYPDVEVRSVDLATLSFVEQVRLVHDETDILVGTHGAGLTHVMFLRAAWEGAGPGSAIVEIQPDTMDYKGFRNLAYMLGHRYFSAKAKLISKEDSGKDEKNSDKIAAAADHNPIAAAAKRGEAMTDEQGSGGNEHKREIEALRELEEEDMFLYRRGMHLEKRAEWHSADVRMEEKEFVELLGSAIEHMRDKEHR
ncbi:uncharacterized protein PgNI_09138 [Pyricularia grisea]|uniref:EGF domain-specific O-linked N-acetylglucosamine transferase n=1 Tax=Pyricularia grisea TaxID=148305 RepID=A0A6P8ASP5_PYRGI|nr:uncharacterized protein PgNI_09138 [Pyricularia grisea]TLD05127.1 hypothetical protein PgNI_09138 [Pyricularia grisea]